MQLFASKMTELAPSSKGSNVLPDEQGNHAVDGNFKVSFEQAQYPKTNPTSVSDQPEMIKAVVISPEQIDADADWHQLVSQSKAIDTDVSLSKELPTDPQFMDSAIDGAKDDAIDEVIDDSAAMDFDTSELAPKQVEQPTANISTQDAVPIAVLNENTIEIDEELLALLRNQQHKSESSQQSDVQNAALSMDENYSVDKDDNISNDFDNEVNTQVHKDSELLSKTEQLALAVNESTPEIDTHSSTQPFILTALNTASTTEPATTVKAPITPGNVSIVLPSVISEQTAPDLDNDNAEIEPSLKAEQALFQLSPKQLEQMAQHLFLRLDQGQKNLSEAQQFVSQLKSGLAEIKAQRQDGQVAGIDLSALVKDSLPKVDIPPLKLEQVVQQLNNTLGIMATNSIAPTGQVVDTASAGLDISRQHTESAVGQLEQTKLPQQTQNAFDKSVNLFKPEGQQQLADKVRWMNNNRQISAELRLDPEDLGAMQVKISMNGDSATVNMVVQSTQAREALDQATPRLRELLAEQGLSLGESSVNQESSTGQQGRFGQDETSHNTDSILKIDESNQTGNIIAEQSIHNGTIGGIDYYA